MNRIIYAALMALGLSVGTGAQQAQAGSGPVVVELFTSQGCSSCPPADEMLGDLAGRDDVIALALHVDYWDYIGWKDIFADPKYTERQRSYARAAGHRSIYTPQFIVQGQDHVIGSKPMKLSDAIRKHQTNDDAVEIALTRSGGKVRVDAQAKRGFGKRMLVQMVTYAPRQSVQIKRGENAGRTLDYHNVVSSWTQVTKWDGAAPLRTNISVDEGASVVVIVQEPGFGQIIAAQRLR